MINRRTRAALGTIVSVAALTWVTDLACIGSADSSSSERSSVTPSADQRRFPLDQMDQSTVHINEHAFRVWLARTTDERAEGLMHVSESEIADEQGMLFVFPDERLRGFWMKDTITALDIAFARTNGRIVKIHTMPPLTEQIFSSVEPAAVALEVKAGTFESLGIRAGDQISIPAAVFKVSP